MYNAPVTIDTLLKDFSGKHFWDISSQVPSESKQEANLQPTELQPDSWRLDDQGECRVLVRVHTLPRLSLFDPERVASCSVPKEELTGKRTTFLHPEQGGDMVTIRDDGDPRTIDSF